MNKIVVMLAFAIFMPMASAEVDLYRYVNPEVAAKIQADPASASGSDKLISHTYRLKNDFGELMALTVKSGKYSVTQVKSHNKNGGSESISVGLYSGVMWLADGGVVERAYYLATPGNPASSYKYMTVRKNSEHEFKDAKFCKLEGSIKAASVIPGLPGGLHKYLCGNKNDNQGVIVPDSYNYHSDYLNYVIQNVYKADIQKVTKETWEIEFYMPDEKKSAVTYGDLRKVF